jgi:hypothetical protein
MSNYSLNKFVREAKPTDNLVTIYDNNGLPAYTVNPLSMNKVLVQKNLVVLTTNKNIVINLDFVDNNEARLALVEIQRQFDIIKRRISSQAEAKAKAIEIVQTGTNFTQVFNQIVYGTQSSGTQSGTQSLPNQGTIESRIVDLVKIISQNINNLQQNIGVDYGPDFINMYESKKNEYDTILATYSTADSLTQRITTLTKYIAQDIYKSVNQNQEKVSDSFNPISHFSENDNIAQDVLNCTFTDESEGPVTILINGVYLKVNNSTQSIAFFSNDNLLTATDYMQDGSILYINTNKLGYDLDENDIITIEYLTKNILI